MIIFAFFITVFFNFLVNVVLLSSTTCDQVITITVPVIKYDIWLSHNRSFLTYKKTLAYVFAEHQILNVLIKTLLCKSIEESCGIVSRCWN